MKIKIDNTNIEFSIVELIKEINEAMQQEKQPLNQRMNCQLCIYHLQVNEELGGVVCSNAVADGILRAIPTECEDYEMIK